MVALRVKNIRKYYYLKNETITALDDISYNFEYGKMYVIMGHSGSGKSTLVQCLGTLDKPTSGQIFIDGEDVAKMSSWEINEIRNLKIGFIFQNYNLNNTMKAYENVMLPMLINKKYRKLDIQKQACKLLRDIGLNDRLNHYPKQLSGGEQQRVAIARAIANDPKIILADEPTGNLDEENELFILKKLRDMTNEGKCVIIVSHNSNIKEYADVVINMKKGKFIDYGI